MEPTKPSKEPFRADVSEAAEVPTSAPAKPVGRIRLRKVVWKALVTLALLCAGMSLFHTSLKPLPRNVSFEGPVHEIPAGDVEFLYDVTAIKDGRRVSEQVIFDRVLSMIREAQDFIFVDMFLFNDYLGKERNAFRNLCKEVTAALIEKKQSRPDIRIIVVTDPVNQVYGGPVPKHFQDLSAAEIPVVLTDLARLRDSNVLYSGFWRTFVQWFGSSASGPLPHPFAKDVGGVSLRSWMALLNFKANHRKLIVADVPNHNSERIMASLVMSANPHDGSSAHNNTALFVRGHVWRDLLQSEQAVLSFSGERTDITALLPPYARNDSKPVDANGQTLTAQVLTENKILKRLLDEIGSTTEQDKIDIGMFYLSERRVIKALIEAAERGVSIRLLLDPNRDAFGYQKSGIPNRPAAAELMKRGKGKILVRWYNTHGEQFHTKLVLVSKDGTATLFTGSANLTRRNIGDFNLETDLVISGIRDSSPLQKATDYFERLWTNREQDFSLPFEAFAERSSFKHWKYRFQEWSGASTF